MAAKKKTAAAAKKPAAKSGAGAAAKAMEQSRARLVKVLSELPPLDERRRRVYRQAFSEEQCLDWGSRTKAAAVHGDAERFVGAVHAILKKGPVTGYSKNRLAWLAHLVGELSDAVASDSAGSSSRAERAASVAIADRARRTLVAGLMSVGEGREAFVKQVTDRNESSKTPHVMESTLTGLLQLAVQARRSPDVELLCEDAGLTEGFLSSVSALIESLRESNEAAYGEQSGIDSQRTNAIEGRVLREMAFAWNAFRRAREAGEVVGNIPPSKLLASLRGGDGREKPEQPATPA